MDDRFYHAMYMNAHKHKRNRLIQLAVTKGLQKKKTTLSYQQNL